MTGGVFIGKGGRVEAVEGGIFGERRRVIGTWQAEPVLEGGASYY